MIFQDNADIPDLRVGTYKHYKGPLYQVLGYSHNASDNNNPQVLYIGLELDPEKPGPRFATRDWKDFLATVCPKHEGVDAYGDEHLELIKADAEAGRLLCSPDNDFLERFEYMGPIYYRGMER